MFKRKPDGSFKARVVAQGWNQVPGLDSGIIYAPVCVIQSVRIICCIAVHFGLLLHQMDVSTAFLHADIQELVFVEQPPGFEVKDRDGGELVMQLEKSLYGLAQSPGNLFNTIDPSLVEIDFAPLQSYTCVYLYDHNGVRVYLTLYVDDLLLASNNSDAMAMVKEKFKQRFKMTDMGAVSLVLGMEIKRDLSVVLSRSLKRLNPSSSWRGSEYRNAIRPTRRSTVPNSPTSSLTRLCWTRKKISATRASWHA